MRQRIRTFDIHEVATTSRHGTFFQRADSSSSGGCGAADAVSLATTLSTLPVDEGGFGLDPRRLWATIHPHDDEAYRAWMSVGLAPDRIVRRSERTNFWTSGVPGPAGPSSKLCYDRGAIYGMEGGPAVDEDRYLELWNLVFVRCEITDVASGEDFRIVGRLSDGGNDTRMGLERMAMILQGVDNLYEIDEIRPILARAAEMTGRRYGLRSGPTARRSHPDDVCLRVVADHVRTALMLIDGGTTPADHGRGRLLRRIVHRALRAMRLLGWQGRALPELLPLARDCMAASYPSLSEDFGRICSIAYAEEEAILGLRTRRPRAATTAAAEPAIAAPATTPPG